MATTPDVHKVSSEIIRDGTKFNTQKNMELYLQILKSINFSGYDVLWSDNALVDNTGSYSINTNAGHTSARDGYEVPTGANTSGELTDEFPTTDFQDYWVAHFNFEYPNTDGDVNFRFVVEADITDTYHYGIEFGITQVGFGLYYFRGLSASDRSHLHVETYNFAAAPAHRYDVTIYNLPQGCIAVIREFTNLKSPTIIGVCMVPPIMGLQNVTTATKLVNRIGLKVIAVPASKPVQVWDMSLASVEI